MNMNDGRRRSEIVDMPVHSFCVTQMARNSSPDAAGPEGDLARGRKFETRRLRVLEEIGGGVGGKGRGLAFMHKLLAREVLDTEEVESQPPGVGLDLLPGPGVRHRGIAAGSVATARNLGMVIGVASAGLIFNHTFRLLNGGRDLMVYLPSMQSSFMTAFRHAMLAGAGMACLGIGVAYLRGPDSGRTGGQGA